MVVAGASRTKLTPISPDEGSLLKDAIYSGLTIRPISHTKGPGSYMTAFIHALMISVACAIPFGLRALFRMGVTKGSFFLIFAKELPLFVLFFFISLCLISFFIAFLNCHILGTHRNALDFHIALSAFTLLPLLFGVSVVFPFIGQVFGFGFCILATYFYQSCYRHITYSSERDSILHYVFVMMAMLLAFILLFNVVPPMSANIFGFSAMAKN